MKSRKLIRNYSNLRDALLDHKAQSIVNSLQGNAHFASIDPSLESFTAIKTSFTNTLAKAETGEKIAIAEKNQVREQLLKAMYDLSLSIEVLAKDDQLKLLSSGFDISSEADNTDALPVPTNLTAVDGLNAGEIKISVKAVPGAISYIHQYATSDEPNADWTIKVSSTRDYLFTGLTAGTRYYFRITAVGRKEQETVSGIVSRIAQ